MLMSMYLVLFIAQLTTAKEGLIQEIIQVGQTSLSAVLPSIRSLVSNQKALHVNEIGDFDAVAKQSGKYVQKVRGFFKAPESGEYKFYSSCSGPCEIYIGQENSIKPRRIISQSEESLHNEFNRYPDQVSHTIYLEQDKLYYIEGVEKQNQGLGHLSVGVILPSDKKVFPISKEYLRTEAEDDGKRKEEISRDGKQFLTNQRETMFKKLQEINEYIQDLTEDVKLKSRDKEAKSSGLIASTSGINEPGPASIDQSVAEVGLSLESPDQPQTEEEKPAKNIASGTASESVGTNPAGVTPGEKASEPSEAVEQQPSAKLEGAPHNADEGEAKLTGSVNRGGLTLKMADNQGEKEMESRADSSDGKMSGRVAESKLLNKEEKAIENQGNRQEGAEDKMQNEKFENGGSSKSGLAQGGQSNSNSNSNEDQLTNKVIDGNNDGKISKTNHGSERLRDTEQNNGQSFDKTMDQSMNSDMKMSHGSSQVEGSRQDDSQSLDKTIDQSLNSGLKMSHSSNKFEGSIQTNEQSSDKTIDQNTDNGLKGSQGSNRFEGSRQSSEQSSENTLDQGKDSGSKTSHNQLEGSSQNNEQSSEKIMDQNIENGKVYQGSQKPDKPLDSRINKDASQKLGEHGLNDAPTPGIAVEQSIENRKAAYNNAESGKASEQRIDNGQAFDKVHGASRLENQTLDGKAVEGPISDHNGNEDISQGSKDKFAGNSQNINGGEKASETDQSPNQIDTRIEISNEHDDRYNEGTNKEQSKKPKLTYKESDHDKTTSDRQRGRTNGQATGEMIQRKEPPVLAIVQNTNSQQEASESKVGENTQAPVTDGVGIRNGGIRQASGIHPEKMEAYSDLTTQPYSVSEPFMTTQSRDTKMPFAHRSGLPYGSNNMGHQFVFNPMEHKHSEHDLNANGELDHGYSTPHKPPAASPDFNTAHEPNAHLQRQDDDDVMQLTNYAKQEIARHGNLSEVVIRHLVKIIKNKILTEGFTAFHKTNKTTKQEVREKYSGEIATQKPKGETQKPAEPELRLGHPQHKKTDGFDHVISNLMTSLKKNLLPQKGHAAQKHIDNHHIDQGQVKGHSSNSPERSKARSNKQRSSDDNRGHNDRILSSLNHLSDELEDLKSYLRAKQTSDAENTKSSGKDNPKEASPQSITPNEAGFSSNGEGGSPQADTLQSPQNAKELAPDADGVEKGQMENQAKTPNEEPGGGRLMQESQIEQTAGTNSHSPMQPNDEAHANKGKKFQYLKGLDVTKHGKSKNAMMKDEESTINSNKGNEIVKDNSPIVPPGASGTNEVIRGNDGSMLSDSSTGAKQMSQPDGKEESTLDGSVEGIPSQNSLEVSPSPSSNWPVLTNNLLTSGNDKAAPVTADKRGSLSSFASAMPNKGSDVTSSVYNKGSDVAYAFHYKGSDITATAFNKGSDLASTATSKGSAIRNSVSNKGGRFVNHASNTASASNKGNYIPILATNAGSDFRNLASTKGSDITNLASNTGSDVISLASNPANDVSNFVSNKGNYIKNNSPIKGSDVAASTSIQGSDAVTHALNKGNGVNSPALNKGSDVTSRAANKGATSTDIRSQGSLKGATTNENNDFNINSLLYQTNSAKILNKLQSPIDQTYYTKLLENTVDQLLTDTANPVNTELRGNNVVTSPMQNDNTRYFTNTQAEPKSLIGKRNKRPTTVHMSDTPAAKKTEITKYYVNKTRKQINKNKSKARRRKHHKR